MAGGGALALSCVVTSLPARSDLFWGVSRGVGPRGTSRLPWSPNPDPGSYLRCRWQEGAPAGVEAETGCRRPRAWAQPKGSRGWLGCEPGCEPGISMPCSEGGGRERCVLVCVGRRSPLGSELHEGVSPAPALDPGDTQCGQG